MKFNTRLIELRKTRNLLQSDVAKELNIGRATYGAYEQGTRQPDLNTLILIANFYNISVDYLLCRSNHPSIENDELDEFINELRQSDKQLVDKLCTIWNTIKDMKPSN